MEEYKILENLYIEKEKENIKLREEIYNIKEKGNDKTILNKFPSFQKLGCEFDTIKAIQEPQNLKDQENEVKIENNTENTPIMRKRISSIKASSSNNNNNLKFSPISMNNNNNDISNISNSKNYLSIFNNELTNFSNSTFNIETNNNTNFNNHLNLNNLMLLDLEIEQHNKSNKGVDKKKLEEVDLMINKQIEEEKNEKREIKFNNQFRGSYENFFNLEENQILSNFINKDNLYGKHDNQDSVSKKDEEVMVNFSKEATNYHHEDLKIIKDNFEKRINDLIDKSERDKEAFQNKINFLEKELKSKKNEKENSRNEIKDFMKNKEISEIQKQVDDFKKRTFEELVKSQIYSEKMFKKYKIYKEKYLKTAIENENFKKMLIQQDITFKEKVAKYLELVKYNEELKSSLEKTNREMALLKKQLEILSNGHNTVKYRNINSGSGKISPQKGQEIVNYNVCNSNRSFNESETDSLRNEKKREEEKIFMLEKNLEILAKENLNLKCKAEKFEHFNINNEILLDSVLEKNFSVQEDRMKSLTSKKEIKMNYLKKTSSSISPLKPKKISSYCSDNHI